MYVSIIIPTIAPEEELGEMISQIENSVAHELDLIVVSGKRCEAKNRNIGLSKAQGDFVIMCDDDVEAFPVGWDRDLIAVLETTGASMVGARLLNPDGSLQRINYHNYDLSKNFVQVKTMITACCVFRNTKLRFDENYKGSGFDDTDFCRQLGGTFFVANRVQVIHRNEAKNQFKDFNQRYFRSKWG